ncbi:signal peptide peptidase SppA [uncultured Alistipes sp.]|uniref:signal peptide peptidase SppA n=1 Tax=uncultured Alistipes sp. TaxID=538949 RepID=UPI002622EF41|nr:signal peptide peptidase SppA [uncultured Alistipes sp.]
MNFFKTFLASLLAVVVGAFLFFFFGFLLLVGIAGTFSMKTAVEVPSEAILRIDLSEVITDAPSDDPLAGLDLMTLQRTPQLSLFGALRAIEAAQDDDRIRGIYLRMNGGGGVAGTAVLEELREALAAFKSSGKFIVSYNESYSQGQYYLASVADRIYIQPEGGMDWSGLSASVMFYKGLFDKLDLKAEVFRPTACRYKSAVEPYILDRMSDANREQMQELVNSLWGTISGEVARARGIDSVKMQRLTDELAVSLPEDALREGFVDGVIYEDQMRDVFAELGVETGDRDDDTFISLGDYAAMVGPDVSNLGADRVAILYADGQIVDGHGSGDAVYGNSLAAQLRELRGDDAVKAVVVRVNSPGGSALASDVIWREMELLRAEKPVVVSMGSYAASGGYYISCPADVIVADRTTLTGSIGVFGMFLNPIDALKNKLGITLDGVRSNTSAGMGSYTALTPAERASIMRGVDKVYTTFTGHVAEGRNLPVERVLEIAGGRVWSGEDALGIGLVDALGGLKTAIALAVDKAGLTDYRVVEVRETPSGLAAMLTAMNVSVRKLFTRSELETVMGEYEKVREATRLQGILMYTPWKVELQ